MKNFSEISAGSLSLHSLATQFWAYALAPASAYLQASCHKFCFPVCTVFMKWFGHNHSTIYTYLYYFILIYTSICVMSQYMCYLFYFFWQGTKMKLWLLEAFFNGSRLNHPGGWWGYDAGRTFRLSKSDHFCAVPLANQGGWFIHTMTAQNRQIT